MNIYKQGRFKGERALYGKTDIRVEDSVFDDGESPLKECKNVELSCCLFRWKYPLWYCEGVKAERCTWFEMARAGVWYSKDLDIRNAVIEALNDDEKIVIAEIAPAIRTSWGEAFGLKPEKATMERLCAVLKRAGFDYVFDTDFAAAITAASSTVGPIIPPSIPMIIYATVTEDSTGKLFMAGVVPGLLMTALFVCYAVYTAKHGGYTPEPKASWSERFKVTFKSLPGIFLPILIIGGIYTGIFTPTEAASVGLVYTLFITMVVYRTIKFTDIPKICLKAVPSSCMIAIIICGALLFGRVMTYLKIPQALTAFVTENKLSAATFIIMMNLLMFVLGALLETVSVVLLTMPLVTPILHTLGVDTIWYGVLVTINMTMALISPPVGMNLYVINGLFPDVKMQEVIKGVIPFAAIIIVVLIIAGLFPQLSLWLPSMM